MLIIIVNKKGQSTLFAKNILMYANGWEIKFFIRKTGTLQFVLLIVIFFIEIVVSVNTMSIIKKGLHAVNFK